MALRETHVDVDFHTDADPLRQINREINGIVRNSRYMGNSFGKISDESQKMLLEMKDGFKQQRDSMMKWRNDLISAEYGFYKLTKSTDLYANNTIGLMDNIKKLGLAHKIATDAMIADDDRVRMSIYRTIGTMANMSTRAEKNADSLRMMNNPLYNANLFSLGLLHNIQKVAQNANPAAIALERLGASANTKQLNDEVRRINQGLGAMNVALILAGLGAIVFYYGMHKMAMGNKEYADSWEAMKKSLRKAIQPMVDVFIMLMVPIYNFIKGIADMIIKFNEAHPTIAKVIQGIILLVPILTLLLLPLGLGVGLIHGYRLALFALMRFAAPVLTFFATMSASVWLVAAALVVIPTVLFLMYQKFEWFRNGVNAIWNGIVTYTKMAWDWIMNTIITPIVNAVVTFVQQKLEQFRLFWEQNGQQIILLVKLAFMNIWTIIKSVMQFIKGTFQVVWPIISGIVQVAWGVMKTIINNTLAFIGGIIKTILAVIRGDWDGAWNAIKETVMTIWENIKSFFTGNVVDFQEIGKDIINGLIEGIKSMAGSLGNMVKGIANNIKKTFKDILDINSPSREMFQLGRFTMQGAGLGMEKEQDFIRQVSYESAQIPMEYTPESSAINTNNSRRSLVFNPSIKIESSSGTNTNIKQQVEEALNEAFNYLTDVWDVEVVR
jgi:phage-related protein